MSFKDFQKAMELVKQYEHLCFLKEGVSAQFISECQVQLGVKFPKSFIEFSKLYGYLMINGFEIFGMFNNSTLRETLTLREDFKTEKKFKYSFIPINSLGNGEISCLDTSQMNEEEECPVIAWYFGATEKLSEDFGAFLLEKVQWALERRVCHKVCVSKKKRI